MVLHKRKGTLRPLHPWSMLHCLLAWRALPAKDPGVGPSLSARAVARSNCRLNKNYRNAPQVRAAWKSNTKKEQCMCRRAHRDMGQPTSLCLPQPPPPDGIVERLHWRPPQTSPGPCQSIRTTWFKRAVVECERPQQWQMSPSSARHDLSPPPPHSHPTHSHPTHSHPTHTTTTHTATTHTQPPHTQPPHTQPPHTAATQSRKQLPQSQTRLPCAAPHLSPAVAITSASFASGIAAAATTASSLRRKCR